MRPRGAHAVCAWAPARSYAAHHELLMDAIPVILASNSTAMDNAIMASLYSEMTQASVLLYKLGRGPLGLLSATLAYSWALCESPGGSGTLLADNALPGCLIHLAMVPNGGDMSTTLYTLPRSLLPCALQLIQEAGSLEYVRNLYWEYLG